MKLSIIIVNWNTCNLLSGCLSSIYAYPPAHPFEVLIVDNASTDASIQMIRHGFPQVHLLQNHENAGFARANNQAIPVSTDRYILLLNPDTQVDPGALETLVEFMDNHPEARAAGARLLNPDGSLQTSCHPKPTLLRDFWRLFHLDSILPIGVYSINKWQLIRPREVDVLMGACMLIRREVLDKVGLLDEDYFIYSEEVDLCHRIQKAGWHLFWMPQAKLIHYGAQSTQQMGAEMFLHLYRSKIIYFRKHYGWLAVQVYKTILLFASFARLLLTPLVLFERSPQRHQVSYIRGYSCGEEAHPHNRLTC